MIARALESKRVRRASVEGAEIIDSGTDSVLLVTSARLQVKGNISSADADLFGGEDKAHEDGMVTGRLKLDIVAANILRVRYAEGEQIPDHITEMVSGETCAPALCTIAREDGAIRLETGKMRIKANLDPCRLDVFPDCGRRVCGIGGPERNSFRNWDAYNTGLCRSVDGGMIAVEKFDLAHDECIYGFGEKFIGLDKAGQTIDLDMRDGLGVSTPRSYKNIPFFVSNKGYGVFFNHSCRMTFWVGSMSAIDLQAAMEDDFLDYFVIVGSIKEVLAGYTDLTGRGAVPPKWTFGFWQSKYSYGSAAEALTVARGMREHGIPCDVIHLDTNWFKDDWYCNLEFSPERFPDPGGFMRELASLGFKVSLWQMPYLPEGSKLFEDLRAVGGFVKNAEGGIYDLTPSFSVPFKGLVGVIDFTNPEAVGIYQEALRRLLRLGVKVIKTDFGEEAPADGVYHDGTPGVRMHNLYPLLYNKAVYEVTREVTGEGVVWARSAWAGSQRYPLHWGGDSTSNFANMAPQLAGGLSLGLSGFQFWSQDIGGSSGGFTDDLLIRWMQWGLFLSHSRIHGGGDRELYKRAPETVRICRDYLQLRYRLLPYIYGSAVKCIAESLPMARALVVEYQDDPVACRIADEYLFGDSLLVAPILTPEKRRQVYLPAGVWTDWWSRERTHGGCWIEVEANLETMPLYIREGAIIPLGPVMNYVGEIHTDQIRLLIAPFDRNGTSRSCIPAEAGTVPVMYEAVAGKHTVTVAPSSVAFEIEVLGPQEVSLQSSQSG